MERDDPSKLVPLCTLWNVSRPPSRHIRPLRWVPERDMNSVECACFRSQSLRGEVAGGVYAVRSLDGVAGVEAVKDV